MFEIMVNVMRSHYNCTLWNTLDVYFIHVYNLYAGIFMFVMNPYECWKDLHTKAICVAH